ncbi:hypothetical protein [Streptomyces yangpuensis]|uniref:hypothetical protein n=1 Tax=Streptomyces yangpuensis TaxID=1648182 RepID=UPI00381DBEB6
MTSLPTDSSATAALAAITLGLDQLRHLALGDTADADDMVHALRAIYQRDETGPSLFGTLTALLDDIADRSDEHGLEDEADALHEAAGFARAHTGPCIGLAIKTITGTDG